VPFLAGGYHLPLASKIAISNAAFIAMMWELTDEEEGWVDNLEDTGAILTFAGTMYVLWIPPVVQGAIAARVGVLLAPLAVPAAVLTTTIIVGGVVSHVIDPEEGLQNYKEFISEPGKWWERTKFTGETIYEQKIEPEVNLTLGVASMLWNMAKREWEERPPLFLTGPHLPF